MRSAPERFTNIVELPTHDVSGSIQDELRGSDIPSDVQGILFKMPSAGKAVLREINEFAGNAAPTIGGRATIAKGGKGLDRRSAPRTPVLLRTRSGNSFSAKEVVVLPIPPADGSYRFRSGSVTAYGLIP